MKVCVVGAGVAGLQTVQVLEEDGHEVTMFEKACGPGGVWRENYDGYALQVPSQLYEFTVGPGMARPHLDTTFPTGTDVQAYIEQFISVTGLAESCTLKYGEGVERIERLENLQWRVSTAKGVYAFDYVVICTGMYHLGQTPKFVVDFQAAKGGKDKVTVLHSSDFLDAAAALKGKQHVAVVGGGKSAVDVAVASVNAGVKTTLLMREMHWPVPRKIMFLIPFQWGTYSRLGHFLLPPHWRLTGGAVEAAAHSLFAPVKWLVWRLLEILFAWQFGLFSFRSCARVKGDALPHAKMEIDLFNGGQILSYEFRDMLLKPGKAQAPLSLVVAKDCARALKELEGVDCVVAATGFKKSYDLFAPDVLQKLDLQEDGLWLYKNVVPAGVEGVAFVGSEVSTFNNILTQYVQAKWLSFHIARPAAEKLSPERMAEYVERERAWKRSWMAATVHRAALTQLHMTRYHDLLLEDVIETGARLPRSCWWEWLLPLTARDFGFLAGLRPRTAAAA